jgi:hypothetical protein
MLSLCDENTLIERAAVAYSRKAARDGVVYSQPCSVLSGVEARDSGRSVVVLRNDNGLLAEYEWNGRRLKAV